MCCSGHEVSLLCMFALCGSPLKFENLEIMWPEMWEIERSKGFRLWPKLRIESASAAWILEPVGHIWVMWSCIKLTDLQWLSICSLRGCSCTEKLWNLAWLLWKEKSFELVSYPSWRHTGMCLIKKTIRNFAHQQTHCDVRHVFSVKDRSNQVFAATTAVIIWVGAFSQTFWSRTTYDNEGSCQNWWC